MIFGVIPSTELCVILCGDQKQFTISVFTKEMSQEKQGSHDLNPNILHPLKIKLVISMNELKLHMRGNGFEGVKLRNSHDALIFPNYLIFITAKYGFRSLEHVDSWCSISLKGKRTNPWFCLSKIAFGDFCFLVYFSVIIFLRNLKIQICVLQKNSRIRFVLIMTMCKLWFTDFSFLSKFSCQEISNFSFSCASIS